MCLITQHRTNNVMVRTHVTDEVYIASKQRMPFVDKVKIMIGQSIMHRLLTSCQFLPQKLNGFLLQETCCPKSKFTSIHLEYVCWA